MVDRGKDGFLNSGGYRIYFRSFGTGEKGTLLCVHGGPGMTHDYLLPLVDLAKEGYRVLFYDALGCGKSELPEDDSLFTVEHDSGVLDDVRSALTRGKVFLMGSSYGGLLVLKYATWHSEALLGVISTGGLTDVPFTVREMNRLREELPPKAREALQVHERSGEFDHPEYLAAVQTFYKRHLCRLDPWPREVNHTMEHVSLPVYHTMNGPNEFTITGNIRTIDFTRDLHRVTVPTLLVHGKYDEVTPAVGQLIHENLPGSRLEILPQSSHLGFWEERPRYMELAREFLRASQARA